MWTQEPRASDTLDGNLTDSVTSVSTVNTDMVGSYSVTYSVSDADGNAAADVIRTVSVVDTTKPVITLVGNATETVEAKKTYVDLGASASDTLDGSLSLNSLSTVNTDALGSYSVTYSVSDANGNAADSVTRTVSVVDTTKPVIALLGSATETVEAKSIYKDSGVSASDTLDGSLTVTTLNTVNTDAVGSYSVTYSVSDANGNAAEPVTRMVSVVDTTKPVITMLGNATETVEAKDTYTDVGASASDTLDGNLTDSVTSVSTVKTDAVGSYSVTYSVSDANGNAAEVTRTVSVVDTTKPVITLLGNVTETLEAKGTYTDEGASASDTLDGSLTVTSVSTVSTECSRQLHGDLQRQ